MITERQTVKHEFFIVRKLKIHQLFETQLGHVDFWRILYLKWRYKFLLLFLSLISDTSVPN